MVGNRPADRLGIANMMVGAEYCVRASPASAHRTNWAWARSSIGPKVLTSRMYPPVWNRAAHCTRIGELVKKRGKENGLWLGQSRTRKIWAKEREGDRSYPNQP